MALPTFYAEVTDLAAYWRPLSPAEQTRADVLLGAAADLINEQAGAEDFVETACKWVSLDMVKRAMLAPGDGVSTMQQGMADMTATVTYTNPAGGLYLTSGELARLSGRTAGSAFSVTLDSNTRVPLDPWTYQPSAQNDGS